jgi:hypothetical protein
LFDAGALRAMPQYQTNKKHSNRNCISCGDIFRKMRKTGINNVRF